MTQSTSFATIHRPLTTEDSPEQSQSSSSSSSTGMRLIVPLQGIVQGRGGLILGSVIPCAMFYFLQFYLKRRRSTPPKDCTSDSPPSPTTELSRSASRSNLLLTRGSIGRPHVSARVCSIAKPNDSCYYIGLDRVSEDSYDRVSNPSGVVQLGLAENRV